MLVFHNIVIFGEDHAFIFVPVKKTMSFTLKGRLVNTTNSNDQPLAYYTIKAFDKDPVFDIFGDDPLGSAVTLDDGSFSIYFTKESFKKPSEFWESVQNEPDLYLKVFD